MRGLSRHQDRQMASIRQNSSVFSDVQDRPQTDLVPQLAPFFGPVHQPQTNPRSLISRETGYLSDAWNGKSEYLGGTIIFAVTDTRRVITDKIMPLRGVDSLEFTYDVFIADEHLLDLAAPGVPPRYVTYRDQKEAGRVYRHALGIRIDHEFHSTPRGQEVLQMNMAQVAHAIMLMIQEIQIRELLSCKNPYRGFLRKYMVKRADPQEVIRQRLHRWCTINKPGRANFAKLFELVSAAMRHEGKSLQYCLGVPGLQSHLALADAASIEFNKEGPDARLNLEWGSERYAQWRNTLIYEVPPLYATGESVQQQVRTRQVGDFALMLDPYGKNSPETYATKKRAIKYFNWERNDWEDIGLEWAIAHCGRWDPQTGELDATHDVLADMDAEALLDVIRKRSPGGLRNADIDKVDMFLTRRASKDRRNSRLLKKTHVIGEMEYAHLPRDSVLGFGPTLFRHVQAMVGDNINVAGALTELYQRIQEWSNPGTDDAALAWLQYHALHSSNQVASANDISMPNWAFSDGHTWMYDGPVDNANANRIVKVVAMKGVANQAAGAVPANADYLIGGAVTVHSDGAAASPTFAVKTPLFMRRGLVPATGPFAAPTTVPVSCGSLRPYGFGSYVGTQAVAASTNPACPFQADVQIASKGLRAFDALYAFISGVFDDRHPLLNTLALPPAFRFMSPSDQKRAALFHALFRPDECVGPSFAISGTPTQLANLLEKMIASVPNMTNVNHELHVRIDAAAPAPIAHPNAGDDTAAILPHVIAWLRTIGVRDLAESFANAQFVAWMEIATLGYMQQAPQNQRFDVAPTGRDAGHFVYNVLSHLTVAPGNATRAPVADGVQILRALYSMFQTTAGHQVRIDSDEQLMFIVKRFEQPVPPFGPADETNDAIGHAQQEWTGSSVAYRPSIMMLSWSSFERQRAMFAGYGLGDKTPVPLFVPPSKRSSGAPAVLAGPLVFSTAAGFEQLRARAKPTFAHGNFALGPSSVHNSTPDEGTDVDMIGQGAEIELFALDNNHSMVMFSDVFYHRLQDVYATRHSFVQRAGALLFMFTRVNFDAFVALARHNLIVPMQFMLLRPFIAFQVATFIWGEFNSGETFYAKPDMQWQDDAATKSRFGNFSCYLGAAVKDSSKVFLTEDVMCMGYVGGGGTMPIETSDDLAEDPEQMDRHMFVFAIPYTASRTDIPEVLDWTGQWDQGYFASRLANGRQIPNGLYNPSNIYYEQMFERISAYRTAALMEEEGTFAVNDPYIPANRICAQTTQMVWDDSKGRMEYIKGCAAYGPDVSKGMRDKLERGALAIIDPVDFTGVASLVY